MSILIEKCGYTITKSTRGRAPKNDAKDDHKPDGKPCHNRRICLNTIHAVDLLYTMVIQPGLV
jgi:hypothetical protein